MLPCCLPVLGGMPDDGQHALALEGGCCVQIPPFRTSTLAHNDADDGFALMTAPGAVRAGMTTPKIEPAELVRRGEAANTRHLVTQNKTKQVQGNRHAATTRAYKLNHQLIFLRYHHKVAIQEGDEKARALSHTHAYPP